MGQTITKLLVENELYGVTTTFNGPKEVQVKLFLNEKLKNASPFVKDNALFRSLLNMSLGSKRKANFEQCDIIPLYLLELEKQVCIFDLELCASILDADSLQLADGSYLQISTINLPETTDINQTLDIQSLEN